MKGKKEDDKPFSIFDQKWDVRFTENEVFVIGEDGSTVARLARPDHGSDLALAGYIIGLQVRALSRAP